MRTNTAYTILNDVATELSLITEDLADPFASTDPNIRLLCRLSKSFGAELARRFPWTQLRKTHTFSTVNGTSSYDLPVDFDRFTPATHWDRSREQPLLGPVAPQGWQVLQSTSAVAGITYFFTKYGNKLRLYPTPTTAHTLAFEYQSNRWVVTSGDTEPTTETPSFSTDTYWYDGPLFMRGLKAKWLQAKSMDSTAALAEFQEAYSAATGADAAAPDLCLNGPGGFRMINDANVPETGFGS